MTERWKASWGRELFLDLMADRSHSWLVFRGGRASGKSTTACMMVLLRGAEKEMRILCAREYQASMEDSVQPLMASLSERYGLGYRKQGRSLIGKNGTVIAFRGVSDSTGTARSLRSMEGVTLTFLEEAQFLTERSMEHLEPTILREDGAQVIAVYNPRFKTDPIHMLAQSGGESVRVVTKNYPDLVAGLLSKTARRHIEEYRDLYPGSFGHVYMGELADADVADRVLQPLALEAMRKAWPALDGVEGPINAGWDVADAGGDMNALAIRNGPRLVHLEAWQAKRPQTVADSARRVVSRCREHGVEHLYYDAGGVGAAATSSLSEMRPAFKVEGIHAGGPVCGADTPFDETSTNRQLFSNRYAQLAWTLRIRADNSRRLLNGEDVDPTRCIAITPDAWAGGPPLPPQLLQPVFAEPAGRIRINKHGDDGGPSPDLFDALAIAFSRDSRLGIRSRLDFWDPVAAYRKRREDRRRLRRTA